MDRLSLSLYAAYPDAYCHMLFQLLVNLGSYLLCLNLKYITNSIRSISMVIEKGSNTASMGFTASASLASAMRSDIYIWNWFKTSNEESSAMSCCFWI
jgi:hypothetical protein